MVILKGAVKGQLHNKTNSITCYIQGYNQQYLKGKQYYSSVSLNNKL
jgi:hypothetical protein